MNKSVNAKVATLVNFIITVILIAIVDFVEDLVTIDAFLNFGILTSVFIASFVGSYLNEEGAKQFIIFSSFGYTIIAIIVAAYILNICTGLACLGGAIFLYSIPIFIVIYILSTALQTYLSGNGSH